MELSKKDSILPITLLHDTRISATSKILLAELIVFINKEKYTDETNKYFCSALNCEEHTISRCITELRKSGYIKVIYNLNSDIKRRIYVLIPTEQKIPQQ